MPKLDLNDMRNWRWFDWLVYVGMAAGLIVWLAWYGSALLGMG